MLIALPSSQRRRDTSGHPSARMAAEADVGAPSRPRVVLAARGDALVPHLTRALRARYRIVADVDAELTQPERLLVAASTFRSSRRAWVERFFKSNLAVALRSRRAARALAATSEPFDIVLQTHALFELADPRAVLYVDCTHRQSAEQWPQWNPLGGRALQRWLTRERRQYHSAAHVFAFSHETQRSLVDDYGVPADRVSVVGAGMNFEDLPDRAGENVRAAAPTVLFVGNDFERKGGPQLLDAFRLVRESIRDARLQIVGTPHPIAPQPGVEVLGRVGTRREMSDLYAGAHVFCLPSVFDPLPLALLEAMAHSLPCVVTPTCGVPEVAVDGCTGLIVDPGPDLVASLAASLVLLLGDPDQAARMGAAGRRRVEERFLWSHVVDRMAEVIDTFPARNPAPQRSKSTTIPTQGARR